MKLSALRLATVALAPSFLFLSITAHATEQPAPVWHSIAFGQSTDVNFSSNVLPEKVGVNDVTINGKKLTVDDKADLSAPITLESRGGKIANTHDGLTFFYTTLPANVNFTLQATVTVDQFGPENGAKPAAQEGAGILVRDIIGAPRQNPLKEGYEEFPAASNMVMNAIMTQDKKSHTEVRLQTIVRNGVMQPWGNAGAKITKTNIQEKINLEQTPSFRMKVERTNDGFVTSYAPKDSDNWVSKDVKGADLVTKLDKDHYYVGFFASRNAKITVSDAQLTTSPAQTKASPEFKFAAFAPVLQVMSSNKSASDNYDVQLRANYAGTVTITQGDKALGAAHAVKAGETLSVPAKLSAGSDFKIVYQPSEGDDKAAKEATFSVEKVKLADAKNVYVSAQGQASNNGSKTAPLDFATAINVLPAGATLWLADGDYSASSIPVSASGSQKAPKKLFAQGKKAVIHGLQLNASHWHVKGIEITEKPFRIEGSYNTIEQVLAHHCDDTGIQVTSSGDVGRPLWASHNLILNSESHSNQDPGKINADGFAVKMRVGEGNVIRGAFSHNNVDDGFDLFNKIEDGANGVVVIENSIAMNNTSNGFKMGGEGQPVAHKVKNSIAVGNQLDGFTDNFNPGALVVENNTALDNQRFNFIFRPSPYSGPEKQGVFKNNVSLKTQEGKYDDAVVGNVDNSNFFIKDGRSVNAQGKEITVKNFASVKVPETFARDAKGNLVLGDFLKKK
ncbi:right-handed parallel beta-helix repeat-containing protein [Candidatus Symbiopectobacterium sp. NZEC135]|uniref:right-handed parallel beta-helix repeat-containing protein n=1 Tax=Candidatus Symbiopectobacterium sp. NZEC135 TaxID=2820471 RepID=UPI002225E4F5|nr:right-handed parallel beta-helix repeat-containing protein [Candidatus Symbiopectobacterium sp. NZEC135]MCW2478637.1 right-handed parallel beta-helix repeat-containing protein [Candidatus Symbiopectobacterium sp. NZEC135]